VNGQNLSRNSQANEKKKKKKTIQTLKNNTNKIRMFLVWVGLEPTRK
jgi:hypothetical protein